MWLYICGWNHCWNFIMKLFKLFCKVLIQKHSIHLQASYRYVWQKQCGRENLLEHSRAGRDCAASLGRLLHTVSRTGKTLPIFNIIVATFCVMRQCQQHSLLYCRNKPLYRLTWRSLKFWNAKAMGEFFLILIYFCWYEQLFKNVLKTALALYVLMSQIANRLSADFGIWKVSK